MRLTGAQVYFHVLSTDTSRAGGNVIYPHIASQARTPFLLRVCC